MATMNVIPLSEDGGWVKLRDQVVLRLFPRLSGSAVKVYTFALVASKAWDERAEGYVNVPTELSQRYVAAGCGLSRASVEKALAELTKWQLLARVRPATRTDAAVYRIRRDVGIEYDADAQPFDTASPLRVVEMVRAGDCWVVKGGQPDNDGGAPGRIKALTEAAPGAEPPSGWPDFQARVAQKVGHLDGEGGLKNRPQVAQKVGQTIDQEDQRVITRARETTRADGPTTATVSEQAARMAPPAVVAAVPAGSSSGKLARPRRAQTFQMQEREDAIWHMVNALVDVTLLPASPDGRGEGRAYHEHLRPAAEELVAAGVTPGQVQAWYGRQARPCFWWDGHWRGSVKGQNPTPKVIVETRLEAARWTPQAQAPTQAPTTGGDRRARQMWAAVVDAISRYRMRDSVAEWPGLDDAARSAAKALKARLYSATPREMVFLERDFVTLYTAALGSPGGGASPAAEPQGVFAS